MQGVALLEGVLAANGIGFEERDEDDGEAVPRDGPEAPGEFGGLGGREAALWVCCMCLLVGAVVRSDRG